MTNSLYVKSTLVQIALKLFPPMIRNTLLEDEDFQKEYAFTTDVVIYLGDSGGSIQRSKLFDAVRMFLSDASSKDVYDKNGEIWELINISSEGELPSLELSRDKYRLVLPNLIGLFPDRTTRIHYFDKVASEVNLPSNAIDRWRKVLFERVLKDDEVEAFNREFLDTPVEQAKSIRNEILKNHFNISTLVPISRKYYERLVGTFDNSSSIHNYATSVGRTFLEQLSEWQTYDGFLFSLFVSSHSALTSEIKVDQLSSEDIVRAFEYLEKQGDRISQLGAIEVGLRVILTRPEIEPILIRLIEQIRDDDADQPDSGFNLFSSLFILVDGKLSRTRLFASEPPFYRRLASLTQAALIHRQIVNSGINIRSFCEWALNNFGEQFYFQSLSDMRLEPCWNPDFAVASQLKAEFYGRIINAAYNYKQNIKEGRLSDTILSILTQNQDYLSEFIIPGPLEGTERTSNILRDQLSVAIETELGAEEVGVSSFIALVNSARIFNVGDDKAKLAARTLKLGNYRIANLESKSQLITILIGLATVAASARSCPLADELRILVRRYRYNTEYSLSADEVMRICLVAASSRAGLNDWRDFVGEWLTELAFGNLEGNDGEALHSHLRCLCHVVPELWVSCGRADAALIAYNGRI
jgi:hypothetical protein